MSNRTEFDEKAALRIKQVVWDSLTRSPGMGSEAEPIWQLYDHEGVAIVITNSLMKVLEQVGGYNIAGTPFVEHGARLHNLPLYVIRPLEPLEDDDAGD